MSLLGAPSPTVPRAFCGTCSLFTFFVVLHSQKKSRFMRPSHSSGMFHVRSWGLVIHRALNNNLNHFLTSFNWRHFRFSGRGRSIVNESHFSMENSQGARATKKAQEKCCRLIIKFRCVCRKRAKWLAQNEVDNGGNFPALVPLTGIKMESTH